MVLGDCVISVGLGSDLATSTQLKSESLSLSHISTSESEGDLTGWGVPSAGGVGSERLAEDALIVRLSGSSIDGIIGPSLGLTLVRLPITLDT